MADRKEIKHSAILNYWIDRGITARGDVSETRGMPVVISPWEPQCWCCGERVFLGELPKCDSDEKLWDHPKARSKLNRCHIVPKSLGGPDSPENLFLMCEACHEAAPDTKNREGFLRWVYRKRQVSYGGVNTDDFLREWQAEVESRGYAWLDFLKKLHDVCGDNVGWTVQNAIKAAGFHGTKIATASVVVGMVDEMEVAIQTK